MNEIESGKLDKLIGMVKTMSAEVDTIKRGVYGDAANRVPGLIDTDREQHLRLKSLEETRKKALWAFGGAFGVFEGLWHWLKN